MTDLFVITSVINTGTHSWSYCGIRSVFDLTERFEQTIKTIESIRNLNDNSKILLVECSDISKEMIDILKTKVDFFIQTYEEESVRQVCLYSDKKGFGEVKQLQKVCEYISLHNILFDRLFKISGRYFLDSNFSKDNFAQDKFSFKMYSNSNSGLTLLYSVPYDLFTQYTQNLNYCIQYYETHPPKGLEEILPIISIPRQHVPRLGVSGFVAVPGDNGKPDFVST